MDGKSMAVYLSIYHDDDQAGRYEQKIKVHKDK